MYMPNVWVYETQEQRVWVALGR